MARVSVTVTDAPGAYSDDMEAITFVAADQADGNQVAITGRELLIVNNTDASPHNVTITSVAETTTGRTEDVAQAVAAGALMVWGPSRLNGWRQSDGMLYFSGDSATLEFAVIRL